MSQTYHYGSSAAGLEFTITEAYDLANNVTNFDVHLISGQMELNALYWSDEDTVPNESIYDATTYMPFTNSMNMNGANTLWDGTTSSTITLNWDGGVAISQPGLGNGDTNYLSIGGTTDLQLHTSGDVTGFGALGVRATTTGAAGGGSIKWVDEPGGGGAQEICWDGRTQGYWGTHTKVDWNDGILTSETYGQLTDPANAYSTALDNWSLQTILNGSTKGLPPQTLQELNLARQVVAAELNAADSTGDNSSIGAHDYAFTQADINAAVQSVYTNGFLADTDKDGVRDSEELQHVLDFYNHGEATSGSIQNPYWNSEEGQACMPTTDMHYIASLMGPMGQANFLDVYNGTTHAWTSDWFNA